MSTYACVKLPWIHSDRDRISTYHHRHSLFMRNLDDLLKIGYIVFGVPNTLDVDGLGLVVDEAGKLLGIISFDELGFNAEARQKHLELIIGSSIQVGGRHNIITCMGQGGKGHELGGLAGGRGDSGDTSFQRGDALFEDIDRWLGGEREREVQQMMRGHSRALGMTYVHDAGVDIAELFEAEQSGAMGTIVEHKALPARISPK